MTRLKTSSIKTENRKMGKTADNRSLNVILIFTLVITFCYPIFSINFHIFEAKAAPVDLSRLPASQQPHKEDFLTTNWNCTDQEIQIKAAERVRLMVHDCNEETMPSSLTNQSNNVTATFFIDPQSKILSTDFFNLSDGPNTIHIFSSSGVKSVSVLQTR